MSKALRGKPTPWIEDMNSASENFRDCDDGIFCCDVSDTALEAAANAIIPGAALSLPNAPTVSILFQCCGND
ncbi:MAG TPA: hypothetical protein VL048_10810 [Xanthobacteraceae bacterium]|nr:hypothetical protein [Xanthobacteraceae bacterium]